mgnify:FL=1|tara:strand:+ start:128 stop:829 length:702 start_codon:yes stop_codon:yes gene_type:complete
MKKMYTGTEVIAFAVAVDQFQGEKYVKSHEVDKEKGIESNFKLMLEAMHNPEKARVQLEPAHTEKAKVIVDYFEGLVFKSMQRKLSDFEQKITELIKAEDININGRDTRLPIVGSLPGVYRNNLTHDNWSEQEQSLRKTAEYVGEVGKRTDFSGTIAMSRYMNRTHSMLVSVLTKDNDIIKFFYDLYRGADKKSFEKGTKLDFVATVKKQEVSSFSKCKETFVNRVALAIDDK